MRWRSILTGSFYLSKLWAMTGFIAATYLLLVTLRRWLFTFVALCTTKGRTSLVDVTPEVLLLAPLRNEAANLPALLSHLQNLDYPRQNLSVVLVDDGSTDGSAALCDHVVASRANWHLLRLLSPAGKAAALNTALETFRGGEFVSIFDADERPEPGALRALVAACGDRKVAAASGRRALANPLAAPVASYVAFESLVHQWVTQRAKDRLRLAPAVLGSNCVYRRSALAQVGGFRAGALLEDTDLTVRLAAAGWRLRFVPEAVSSHHAPQTLLAYWQQHVRWAAGFQDVVQQHAAWVFFNARLPWLLRLELAVFSLGYADRLALPLVAAFSLRGRWKGLYRGLFVAALLTPFLQVVAALHLGRAPAKLWLRLPYLPLFYLFDLAMAITGIARRLLGRLPAWEGRGR